MINDWLFRKPIKRVFNVQQIVQFFLENYQLKRMIIHQIRYIDNLKQAANSELVRVVRRKLSEDRLSSELTHVRWDNSCL
jgi:hypothetical protein